MYPSQTLGTTTARKHLRHFFKLKSQEPETHARASLLSRDTGRASLRCSSQEAALRYTGSDMPGKSTHNNICISSIFVSEDGHWKLGGMETVCKFSEATPEDNCFKILPDKHGHARDAYSFGILVEKLFPLYENDASSQDGLMSPALYRRYIIPHLLKLFKVNEEHVRIVLLLHIEDYAQMFSQDELKHQILPQVLLGMRDTSDVLVAMTLQSLAVLVPLLGAQVVVGGERTKVFKRTTPNFTKSADVTPEGSPVHVGNNFKAHVTQPSKITSVKVYPKPFEAKSQKLGIFKSMETKEDVKLPVLSESAALRSAELEKKLGINGYCEKKEKSTHLITVEEWPDWSDAEDPDAEKISEIQIRTAENNLNHITGQDQMDEAVEEEPWDDFEACNEKSVVYSSATVSATSQVTSTMQKSLQSKALKLSYVSKASKVNSEENVNNNWYQIQPPEAKQTSQLLEKTSKVEKNVLNVGLGEEFTIHVKRKNQSDPEMDLFADMVPDIKLSSAPLILQPNRTDAYEARPVGSETAERNQIDMLLLPAKFDAAIDLIEGMVQEASKYLFTASKKRFYFKDVKILIPVTWAANPKYGRPKTESYAEANVIIAAPYVKYGNDPYTLQYGGCGEEGRYIHLTPDFLTDDAFLPIYGPRERVLVHEWAHLRWGVYDEYNEDKPFYYASDKSFQHTRCSVDIAGAMAECTDPQCSAIKPCEEDQATGSPTEKCQFFPEKNQRTTSSIMFFQGLNATAQRKDRLRQAAELFILQIIETGSQLGIVQFNSAATTLQELTTIKDDATRTALTKRLPNLASGGTSICSGIRKAFEEFKKQNPQINGNEIVLLTDGEDGTVGSCVNEVQTSGTIVHTIALGPSAAKELETMSNITGGLQFSATDSLDSNGLIDAFAGISSRDGNTTNQALQLESAGKSTPSKDWLNGTVPIDRTVGNDTFFVVTWQADQPTISVFSPTGIDHSASADAIKNDGVYSGYFINFSGNGRYSLKVKVQGGESVTRLSDRKGTRAYYNPGYYVDGKIEKNPDKPPVPEEDLQTDLGNFTRTTTGGVFVVTGSPPGAQPPVFPPCQITDLDANIKDEKVFLKWTAPGGNMDQGTAAKYEIRMSTTYQDLKDQFDNATVVNTSNVAPQEAGNMESFSFKPEDITIENGTIIYFAARAVGSSSLMADVSNIAQGQMVLPYIPAVPDPNPNPNPGTSEGTGGINITTLVLAITCSIAGICIIASISMCIVKKTQRRRIAPAV
ncbi:PACE1 protein, partial [Polypterus senegalus]